MTTGSTVRAGAPRPGGAAALQAAALQAAAPVVLALAECGAELRAEALELFRQLQGGQLDEDERFATVALLADLLFPAGDDPGAAGVDLHEAEQAEAAASREAGEAAARLDEQEAVFARRLRELMTERGLTQAQLAEKVGIGQPAVSMLLNRACRPQRRTVARFAQALGVAAEELWPGGVEE